MSTSIYSKLKMPVFWQACLAALALLSPPAMAAGPTATNPYAWYRADIGVAYDGGSGAVNSWADQSGNGRNLGVIGTPLLNANGLIETDAGIFFSPKSSWGTAAPGTVVAVWSCDASPPGSSFVYHTQGGMPDQHMGNEDPGDNQGSSFGDVASWSGGSIFGYNFPREDEDLLKISVASYTGVGDNSDFLTIRDMSGSLLINETGNCESGGMDGLAIGGAESGGTMNHRLEGVVAEVIVYEGDLSPAEIAEIEAVLMTRTYEREPTDPNHPVPSAAWWNPSNSDLVNAGSGALAGMTTDFQQGTPDFLSFPDPALINGTADAVDSDAVFDDDGFTLTFALDTSATPQGYDITGTDTYAAGPSSGSDSRGDQHYTLLVEYVDDPGNFILLGTFDAITGGVSGGTKLMVRGGGGATDSMAERVSAVRFVIPDVQLDSFYREFDIFGQASLEPMPGDANRDGVVDDTDAAILADNWMGSAKTWTEGDFNDDGVVDGADATLMATNWTIVGSAAAVPEPAMAVLLVCMSVGLFGLVIRRRS